MKSIAEIFGRPHRTEAVIVKRDWPLNKCLMGVEIEVELIAGVVTPDKTLAAWSRKSDSSLRNGFEYILREPLAGDRLATAIHDLLSCSTFKRSITGSTHIHMDMLEKEITHTIVQTIVVMMFVLEPAIYVIADPGREWCGYTNKLNSAPPTVLSAILNSENDNLESFVDLCAGGLGVGRYYGLNVMALQKFGSLEFRYFPTATSEDELIDWVNLVQSFKVAAMAIGNVSALIETLTNEKLYKQFLDTYFNKWQDVFLHEVPAYAATQAAHKALALASTYNIEPESYDASVISNNKMLRKFTKGIKTPEEMPVNPVYIHRPSTAALIPTASVAGETIWYEGAFLWAPTLEGWRRTLTVDIKEYSYDVIVQFASHFRESVESFLTRLVASGCPEQMLHNSILNYEHFRAMVEALGLTHLGTIIPAMVDPSVGARKLRLPSTAGLRDVLNSAGYGTTAAYDPSREVNYTPDVDIGDDDDDDEYDGEDEANDEEGNPGDYA